MSREKNSKSIKKLDPAIISSRITQILREKRITQQELADVLGVAQSAISKYFRGRIPKAETIYNLSSFSGKSIEWLLGIEPLSDVRVWVEGEKADFVKIPIEPTPATPILARCPAGLPQSWVIEQEYLDEHIPYVHDLIPSSPEMFGLRITGDSMCPFVQPGDVVLVDLAREWKDGDVVVARLNGEEHTLKFIEGKGGSNIRLIPANPAYRIAEISLRQVEWIGVAAGLYREDPRGKTHAGSAALVTAMQFPQVGDLAVLLAVMPEEFLEALRTALRTAEPQPDRRNTDRFARWMERIYRRAQEEIDKLLEK